MSYFPENLPGKPIASRGTPGSCPIGGIPHRYPPLTPHYWPVRSALVISNGVDPMRCPQPICQLCARQVLLNLTTVFKIYRRRSNN